MGAGSDEYSHCRKATLNFSEIVAYLLEAKFLKNLLESSLFGDQDLTILGREGKVKNHGVGDLSTDNTVPKVAKLILTNELSLL